jgi:NADH-quinone oxidoreductase subunit J
MIDTALFYFFALLTLGGAALVVTRRSAVLSAVWLIVSLLGVGGLFLLLGAEFLFAAQIILYIGGITLLFLFVIMLVNLDAAARLRQFRRSWPVIAAASVGLAAELVALLLKGQLPAAAPSHDVVSGNTEALGAVLLSKYLVAFELASIVLLVAIVGSVWMGQPRGNQDIERPQG